MPSAHPGIVVRADDVEQRLHGERGVDLTQRVDGRETDVFRLLYRRVAEGRYGCITEGCETVDQGLVVGGIAGAG